MYLYWFKILEFGGHYRFFKKWWPPPTFNVEAYTTNLIRKTGMKRVIFAHLYKVLALGTALIQNEDHVLSENAEKLSEFMSMSQWGLIFLG